MNALDLQSMERRSWRLFQRDGLTDALFGAIFLASAVVGILDQTSIADGIRIATLIVIQFGGVLAMILLRKRYVMPRLGRVKYAPRRVRRTRIMRTFLAVCIAITVLLVVLTRLSGTLGFDIFRNMGGFGVWLLISAVVLVPIGAIAYFMEYPRLLLYGGFLSIAEFMHVVVELPKRVAFGAAYIYGAFSIIAFAIGITIFVGFLRSTPRPDVPAGAVEVEEPVEDGGHHGA